MIEVIKYKCCNKIFAACTEPECHTNSEWLENKKSYLLRGDVVDMTDTPVLFGKCECKKPIHAKPSLYAYYFDHLKEVAKTYGYNLVLHGSMNRDLDLIAIPWAEDVKPHYPMIEQFASILGGAILSETSEDRDAFAKMFHGRRQYSININRDIEMKYDGMVSKIKEYADPQYYIDISVTPIG